ncbi:hypothetical protein AK830_g4160 [Neonectria ditissima]|uniref:Uncharacterized protein n=1 Tax=Neonectria ditissima TaxID=78410 RepID=A0A0P7BNM7_9HYPO|nr:hypothetical protein AK830_g4160 [Neonectria ditissima]
MPTARDALRCADFRNRSGIGGSDGLHGCSAGPDSAFVSHPSPHVPMVLHREDDSDQLPLRLLTFGWPAGASSFTVNVSVNVDVDLEDATPASRTSSINSNALVSSPASRLSHGFASSPPPSLDLASLAASRMFIRNFPMGP